MGSKHTTEYSDYVNEPNCSKLSHIPGDDGLPVIGRTIEFVTDPYKMAMKNYQKFGLLSRVFSAGTHSLIALGPDLTQQILLDKDRVFSSRKGYFERISRFFTGSLIMEDFEHHRHQRRIMQTAFKSESLKLYTSEINRIYDHAITEWEADDGKTILFFEYTKHLLLQVAAEIFIGEKENVQIVEKLNRAFIDCADGPAYLCPIPFPGNTLYKGLKGSRFLDNYFDKLVPQKRDGDGTDMLSCFCRERDEHGKLYSDKEISYQIKFLMLAAHDTTTAAITHAIYYLARNPECKERLYQECLAIGKEQLDYEDLDSVPYMQNVFFEVLRLRPSAPVFPRRTIKEVEMAGHKVPAHTLIQLIPRFNHMMPEYWTEPEKFDPDRFSPERAEHKKHPFQFFPFGGGAHKCIGMHFSQMEFKCFLYKFILRFDFEARHKSEPKMMTIPIPKPGDAMPIKLIRR